MYYRAIFTVPVYSAVKSNCSYQIKGSLDATNHRLLGNLFVFRGNLSYVEVSSAQERRTAPFHCIVFQLRSSTN